GRKNGDPARNAVHADPKDLAADRSDARVWHRPAYPTDFERGAASRGRLAVSGAAAHADQGLGDSRVAAIGKHPACALLFADAERQETTGCGNRGVREGDGSHYARDSTGLILKLAMDDFFRRLRFYFRRRQFEAELQEELEQHAALS